MRLFLLAFFAVLFIGCDNQSEEETVKRKRTEPTFRHDGQLWIINHLNGDTISELRIEMVQKRQDIEYGMMFRTSMEEDMGMLFFMQQERPQSFYMKNTYVSLDIIYINRDKEIVSIVEKAEPLSEKSLPSGKPALYVLEVIGGYSAKYGVKPGNKIDFVEI
ncbi:MAG: DUF192 domain-containing protein [Cryomorphaceae bacterium]|nr:DUF192 domain-containing protein [Cryomorphaceae bacterium]